MDVGASLGIPALTAHRCLTVSEPGAAARARNARGADGPGGGRRRGGRARRDPARALGRRASLRLSATTRRQGSRKRPAPITSSTIGAPTSPTRSELAPAGVDIIVEVAPIANAALGEAVLAAGGTIAVYATDDGDRLELSIGELMDRNARYQFVLVYTVPSEVKDEAVADVSAAVADGSLPVGADAGLHHRFELGETADAHAAVEGGAVGKVLIDVS